MMMLERSGAHLDPKPLYLVLLLMNLKSTVGQYMGRGIGQERGSTVEKLKVVHTF